MDRLSGRSWKEYYTLEREMREVEIREKIRTMWNEPDPQVEDILARGGALSIPHTHLDSTLEPLVRTVRAIYATGKDSVLAVGLIHFTEKPDDEFCLDGLASVLGIASDEMDLPEVRITNIFIERDKRLDPSDLESIVSSVEGQAKKISDRAGPRTAIVITGDLVHYGYGYKMTDVEEDPRALIDGMVRRSLDLLYKRDDMTAFLKYSREVKSDQMFVGIALKAAMGGKLDYKIFSTSLADYSEVLEVKKPTVVASVFYGVMPEA